MNENWFELIIIAVIMLGIGIAVWKGGAANPEGTGSLGRKVTKLDKEVISLTDKVTAIQGELTRIDNNAASKADIRRLEKSIASIEVTVSEISKNAAAREATLDHVRQQVDRLYDHIVTKGMNS